MFVTVFTKIHQKLLFFCYFFTYSHLLQSWLQHVGILSCCFNMLVQNTIFIFSSNSLLNAKKLISRIAFVIYFYTCHSANLKIFKVIICLFIVCNFYFYFFESFFSKNGRTLLNQSSMPTVG